MNKCLERVCGFGGGCEVFYGNDLEDFECADVVVLQSGNHGLFRP